MQISTLVGANGRRRIVGGGPVDNGDVEGRTPKVQDDPYAKLNDDGQLELTFDSLNPDAETTIPSVFRIVNLSSEELGIYIEKEESAEIAVEFLDGEGNSLNGADNAQDVKEGDSVDVTVEFDTHGYSGDELIDTIYVHGDSQEVDNS